MVAVPEALMDAERLPHPAPPLRPDLVAPAAGPAPLLSVSDKVVDLGPPGKRARAGQRVAVVNDGQGTLKGRVTASVPWISLNVREFTGDQVEMTISGRNRGLTPGHQHWAVPNLFTVLPSGLWRALTRSRLRGLLVLALIIGVGVLADRSAGAPARFGGRTLLGVAAVITQVLLLLVAWQVTWFVPAPRQHVGQVEIESNGGTRQIEVRMQARPGFFRKALWAGPWSLYCFWPSWWRWAGSCSMGPSKGGMGNAEYEYSGKNRNPHSVRHIPPSALVAICYNTGRSRPTDTTLAAPLREHGAGASSLRRIYDGD